MSRLLKEASMNQSHKNLIRDNYTSLIDAISPQIDDVINYLFEQKIISKHMKEDLECIPAKHKKTTGLLDLITSRGPKAFDFLHLAVEKADLHEASVILKPDYVISASTTHPQADDYDSLDGVLPDRWPAEDEMEAYNNVRMVDRSDTVMITRFKKSVEKDHIYTMSAKPRGRMLLINNEVFAHMDDRQGASRDRIALETLFQKFSFSVRVKSNRTAEKMWELLKDEAIQDDHNKADCFVLFIASHGYKGVVFGTDGKMDKDKKPQNCLEIEKIVDLFCEVKSLQGKPKLIFIQACQGEKKNYGYSLGADDRGPADAGSDTPKPEAAATIVSESGDKEEDRSLDIKKNLEKILPSNATDSDSGKRPSYADVFVSQATIPDFVSWRNTIYGSWYIQAIAFVFSRYACKFDLLKLMTLVNNLVGRAETAERFKQVGEKRDRFDKDLYFFPGL